VCEKDYTTTQPHNSQHGQKTTKKALKTPSTTPSAEDDSKGLPPDLQKKLLVDIKLRGGLNRVKLSNLIKEKKDKIYGDDLVNPQLKKKVQNFVSKCVVLCRAENKLNLVISLNILFRSTKGEEGNLL